MGCSCRKYNLNESIYELADTLSDRDVDRKFSLFNKITKTPTKVFNKKEDIINIERYNDDIILLLNKTRKHPNSLTDTIMKHIELINDNNELVVEKEIGKEIKISLFKGKEEFKEVCNQLNSINSMSELEYNSIFNIDITDFSSLIDSNNSINIDILSSFYGKHYAKLKQNGYDITGFHYDISPDSEISIILQLVDDNNSHGQRRKNLLNKESKFIGISSYIIDNYLICSFLTFGKQTRDLIEDDYL